MPKLKDITKLPVAESADSLFLIANDNGSAKQIPASTVGAQADFAVTDPTNPAFIKNKPVYNKKEPFFEWNFDASDEVYTLMENIASFPWLVEKSDSVGWEIVVEQYGLILYGDGGEEVNPNVTTILVMTDSSPYTRYQNDGNMFTYAHGYAPEDWHNNGEISYSDLDVSIHAYDKIRCNDFDNGVFESANLGALMCYVNMGGPFKSIKISRITH